MQVLWLIEHVKSGLQSFVPDDAARSRKPVEADRDQMETLTENNQRYTTQERAGMLKISKSIKLLVKMKTLSFILQEKTDGLFDQPNTWASSE